MTEANSDEKKLKRGEGREAKQKERDEKPERGIRKRETNKESARQSEHWGTAGKREIQ